jgi:H+/gluconate symporter-like permease
VKYLVYPILVAYGTLMGLLLVYAPWVGIATIIVVSIGFYYLLDRDSRGKL